MAEATQYPMHELLKTMHQRLDGIDISLGEIPSGMCGVVVAFNRMFTISVAVLGGTRLA